MRYQVAAFGSRYELRADMKPEEEEPVFRHIKTYHSLEAVRAAVANIAKKGGEVDFDRSLTQYARAEISHACKRETRPAVSV